MPILDCSVKSCMHNQDNKCSLDSIKVEGKGADYSDDTACGNYQLRTSGQMMNGCCKSPKNNLSVTCAATKCVFNEGNMCKAEHIGIAGGNAGTMDETECASFVPNENK